MAKPLKDILSAITRDIDQAAVSADVNQAHWQHIYDNSELLQGFAPSRVRIVEVNLSLPLAFDRVTQTQVKDYGITTDQVYSILPVSLSKRQRMELAKKIHILLVQQEKHYFLNNDFRQNILGAIVKIIPDIDPEKDIDLNHIEKIKQEFIAQPNADREAMFIYKAKDLEKIDPGYIMKMNITLGVD